MAFLNFQVLQNKGKTLQVHVIYIAVYKFLIQLSAGYS